MSVQPCVYSKRFIHGIPVWYIQWTLTDSVAAGDSSGEQKLQFPKEMESNKGIIDSIRVSCNSTDYNITLQQKSGLTFPDIDIIWQTANVNQMAINVNLDLHFVNWDTSNAESIIIVVDNNAGSPDTGNIDIAMVISEL